MRVFRCLTIGAMLWGGTAFASPVSQSLRPAERPAIDDAPLVTLASAPMVRPQMRPKQTMQAQTVVQAENNPLFLTWIKGFRTRAMGQGISGATFDQAFRGVQYDPDVVARDRSQSEFTKTIWQYLASAVSENRVRNGQVELQARAQTLAQIEARFGVEREVVLAVWGLESSYGQFRGKNDVVQSLATLAFDGRRGPFFESQLIAALQILQAGDVAPRGMTGSWAGAMGHTQFIPTSYLDYAVDFDGDGKRDIWSDDPSDALASTAAYLKRFGWTQGQPWGVEVTLPAGFDYELARRDLQKAPTDWAGLGVLDTNGTPVPDHGPASVLLPAGSKGAAFMIFSNFEVIERYNTADAYVIGVGHLSDRIKGLPPIKASWPEGDRALTNSERKELQRLLTGSGFDTQGIDGRIGPKTIAAVRAYQRSTGAIPDGYANTALLNRLRVQ